MKRSSPKQKMTISTTNPAETQAWGTRLAKRLQVGDFVALCGPLGAGKTCFAQGLGAGLGIQSRITSPTFIIIRHHPGPVPLCHADAYRVNSPAELEEAGLLEYLASAVIALEWADQVPELWPANHFVIKLDFANDGRQLELSATGPRQAKVISELADAYPGN